MNQKKHPDWNTKMVQQSLLLYSLLLAEWKQPKGPQGIYARLSGVQGGKKGNSEFTNGSTINTLSSLAHLGVLNTDITPENISSRLWPTFNWFISVSTFFYSMCVLKKCFWCYFLTSEDRIAHDFVCVYVWFRFWVRNRLLVRFSSWCYFSTESNYLWHFRVCILWTYLSN